MAVRLTQAQYDKLSKGSRSAQLPAGTGASLEHLSSEHCRFVLPVRAMTKQRAGGMQKRHHSKKYTDFRDQTREYLTDLRVPRYGDMEHLCLILQLAFTGVPMGDEDNYEGWVLDLLQDDAPHLKKRLPFLGMFKNDHYVHVLRLPILFNAPENLMTIVIGKAEKLKMEAGEIWKPVWLTEEELATSLMCWSSRSGS